MPSSTALVVGLDNDPNAIYQDGFAVLNPQTGATLVSGIPWPATAPNSQDVAPFPCPGETVCIIYANSTSQQVRTECGNQPHTISLGYNLRLERAHLEALRICELLVPYFDRWKWR